MNALVAQLTHIGFADLADALRASIEDILREWDLAVREALPQLDRLTLDELRDGNPKLLRAIADALASSDPHEIKSLYEQAPQQGLARLRHQYDVIDVMQEDGLLRGLIVLHIEQRLGRQTDVPEAAALHATIDLMLQRSIVALVDQQKEQLREAAERELKFLTFLSHDLTNNLSAVTLHLKLLRQELRSTGKFPAAVDLVESSDQSIQQTVEGMRRLLEHEMLRKGGHESNVQRVDLESFVTNLCKPFCRQAEVKGMRVVVETEPCIRVRTDAELVALVLRNLIGNALKFASTGTLRVSCAQHDDGRSMLCVTDDGPGIAQEHLNVIFEAFRRGDARGREGVGLGLAIASQAAKLLDAELTVESKLGSGSTFRLTLPPGSAAARGRR